MPVFTEYSLSLSLNVTERLNRVSRYFSTQVKEPVTIIPFPCACPGERMNEPLLIYQLSFSHFPPVNNAVFPLRYFGSQSPPHDFLSRNWPRALADGVNRGPSSRLLVPCVLSHLRVTNEVSQFLSKGLKTAEKHTK